MNASPVSATVILCTRNRAHALVEALNALAAMQVDERVQWDVLVVDNGSTDGTALKIKEFIESGHPRFVYTYEPQAGKTHALNRALAEARGEILAFTDDDAVVDRRWLMTIIETMDRYSADGVGGRVLPIWDAPRPEWLKDNLLNVLAILDLGSEIIRLDWTRPPLMLYGVNMAFRRSVFCRLGAFKTTLGSRAEDWDLFNRLAAAKANVVYDPAIVVQHHISGDRLTKGFYRKWHRANGRAQARLHPGPARAVLGVPLHTIRAGMATGGMFLRAVITRDRDTAFRNYLMLNLYASYYWGRIRAALSSQSPETQTHS